MKRGLIIAALLLPALSWAGNGDDDFGFWLDLGAEKNFTRWLSAGVETELRTENNTQKVDRWDIGADVDFKVHKYLKLGVAYDFLYGYTSENTNKKKYYYPGYWAPRHRFSFDASSSVKIKKWIRISLRERYQFTHRADQNIDRYEWIYDGDGNRTGYDKEEGSLKLKEGEDKHILRSRLKVELARKRLAWSPFISVETQNNLTERMDLYKVRTAVGTSYKINKHNSLQVAYIFTCKWDETNQRERMHAIDIGYNYNF